MKQRVFLFFLVAIVTVFTGCAYNQVQDDSQLGAYQLTLQLNLKQNGNGFNLNTDYTNAFGETYRVSKFQFYISNISLLRNGVVSAKNNSDYFLVSAGDAVSQKLDLNVGVNEATGIQFLLGVDSIRNVSGAQAGALDPMNGMFWTWSTGYIMAKLEGISPQSTQPSNALVYHIGGFTGANNATRLVTLIFPPGKPMKINRGGTCELLMDVAVNKWFNGVHDMKIADFAGTMSPGGPALKIADNYATLFSITDVINK